MFGKNHYQTLFIIYMTIADNVKPFVQNFNIQAHIQIIRAFSIYIFA